MPPIPPNLSLNDPAPGRRRMRTLRTALTVAAAFAVAAPAAFFAATGLKPQFRAEGALWVAGGSEDERRTVSATEGTNRLAGAAWIELLRSYVVLDPVAAEHLRPATADGSDDGEAVRAAAGDLSRRLMVAMDTDGSFLRVAFEDPEPAQAVAVVQAVMDRYVEVAADLKSQKLAETVAVLEEQLEIVLERLAEAERDLEGFRVGTISSPDGEALATADWKAEEGRLRRRVRSHEGLYDEIRGRLEQARLAQVSSIPDVRILDMATVQRQRWGLSGLLLAMAIFVTIVGAVFLGTGLAERIGMFETATMDRM